MRFDSGFFAPAHGKMGASASRVAGQTPKMGYLAAGILCLLFILTVSVARVFAQEVSVTASVDADTVGVLDQLQLTITVSGKDSGDAENPRISRLPGFRVVSGPNISTQFQWVNGRSSSSKRFTYILIPEKEGLFTIDPIEVSVGRKVFKTQPLQVRVTPGSRNPPAQRRRPLNPFDFFMDEQDSVARRPIGDSVFIRAELDRAEAYLGQQVTLSYQLYTQVGVNGIQIEESPPLAGFWVEDIEVEKNPKAIRRVVNGREYQVVTIKKQALFATATGKLKIPPSTFALSVNTEEDFLGVFARPQTVYRRTEETQLEIKPLPTAGRPPGFRNAVGSFQLKSEIDRNRAATGEAVSLKVTLYGKGNIRLIPDISLPPLPDFTVYSSKRTDAVRPQPNGQIGGEKTWEFILVPKVPGKQTIPSFSFPYFDIERNTYQTLVTQALDLQVERGADASTSLLSGGEKQDLVRRGTDIHFIKLSSGKWERGEKPLYRSWWFFTIAALPPLANIGIYAYRRRRARHEENTALERSRKAKRTALNRLKEAEEAGRNDPRRFYDLAAAALTGYLRDKFGMTDIELTADSLERNLSDRSIPREILEETRACLQECDFHRFVSPTAPAEEIKRTGDRIRKNISALDGPRKKPLPTTLALIVLILSAWNLYAQPPQESPEQLFARGNAEYQQGNYDAAKRHYLKILEMGYENGPLYFNLGNACFKQKRVGEAVYYWEKARMKMPTDPQVRDNLELANLMIIDRVQTPEAPYPVRLFRDLTAAFSTKQAIWIGLGLFIAVNLLFAMFLLAATPRSAARFLWACICLSLLFLVFVGSTAWRIYEQDYVSKAVVMEQQVDVRSGPGHENIQVFTIHEGLTVRVHASTNGWLQISLPNGWSGWLPACSVRIL